LAACSGGTEFIAFLLGRAGGQRLEASILLVLVLVLVLVLAPGLPPPTWLQRSV
jgi:hypothetical protein